MSLGWTAVRVHLSYVHRVNIILEHILAVRGRDGICICDVSAPGTAANDFASSPHRRTAGGTAGETAERGIAPLLLRIPFCRRSIPCTGRCPEANIKLKPLSCGQSR